MPGTTAAAEPDRLDLREVLLGGVRSWNAWRQEHPEAEIDLYEANLSRANLREANLSRANLLWAYLRQANLSRANLCGAHLCGAYLSRANLREANLSAANLREANLFEANLRGASFGEADLHKANLRGTNLHEANLSGADLCGAYLDETLLARLRRGAETASIHVFDESAEFDFLEDLERAVREYTTAAGYFTLQTTRGEGGRFLYKTEYGLSKPIAPHSVEVATQEGIDLYQQRQADASATLEVAATIQVARLANGIARILGALEKLRNSVLHIGKLFVIKHTDAAQSRLFACVAPADLARELTGNPEILQSSQSAIHFLESRDRLPEAIETIALGEGSPGYTLSNL